MYICIHCGAELEELYRRYCPSVLKVLKCEKCMQIADKYIEYDPVIVFLDLVLIEKQAYRHLLYNSEFKSYWKLMIILWLGESLAVWFSCNLNEKESSLPVSVDNGDMIFQGNCDFFVILFQTAMSLGAFICAVVVITELYWLLIAAKRPHKYRVADLCRALVIGGCAKLLGLLSIVWRQIATTGAHYVLIQGYTLLCLLTAYSVVCKNGKAGSLIGLTGGFLAHNYVSSALSTLPMSNNDYRGVSLMGE